MASDVPVTFKEVSPPHSSHTAAQAASLPFSEGRDGGGASSLHTALSQGL